ncbi:hypothetical protein ONS95_005734 [Cadophora gregata]|uniref:uncharacterized protein n=1 Tax=Cadophora gregata TaxID=51156 RepID=UPI0026DB329E|nr:uncharacterized protein ONS95_005734 [Cadophora gregata]KAK0103728.1 hypothetical protein ONS95_005734 [Cadophora gregata]KAK0107915.1 hypothetical protein ONS96_003702 [Cadophora gregata f. sp. sojae]
MIVTIWKVKWLSRSFSLSRKNEARIVHYCTYDGGGEPDEDPSYMVIYETLHDICEEQRSIMDNGVDLSVLSSTFGALARVKKLGLKFCEVIDDDSSLSPFTACMTTVEDSYEYHPLIVSDAIQSSRNRGTAINTVSLSGFNLPYYHQLEVPDLSTLLKSLDKRLQSVRVICVSDSRFSPGSTVPLHTGYTST